MLKHSFDPPRPPKRVVVIGGKGFVASAVAERLERGGVPVRRVGRAEIDLLAPGAAAALAAILQPDDAVVAASAIAPCKNGEQLVQNMVLARAIADALAQRPVTHVLNVSSDAVYADDLAWVNEASPAAPTGLHGAMHLAREILLRSTVRAPLCILRPSLLYGAKDPHNGYGPNRFRRLAAEGKEITLFGEGEEKRDHVFIDDVAEIAALCLAHRSAGVLNVATGVSTSFRQVAEACVAPVKKRIDVKGTPRKNPITHRHFDVAACLSAFPMFHFTPLDVGLARMQAQSTAAVRP